MNLGGAPWLDAETSTAGLVVLAVLVIYLVVVEPRLGVRFFDGFRRATALEPPRRGWWFAGLVAMQVAALGTATLIVVSLPGIMVGSVGLQSPDVDDGLLRGMVVGAVGGMVVGVVFTAVAARRGEDVPMAGDTGVLLPHRRSDRAWLGAVAVGAGTSEEVVYRGLLPALAVGAGAPVIVALLGQAAVFGAAHRYQGWGGVAMTSGVGLAFGFVTVLSGSLFIPLVLHVLMDARLAFGREQGETRCGKATGN